jgi:hypothetical protein
MHNYLLRAYVAEAGLDPERLHHMEVLFAAIRFCSAIPTPCGIGTAMDF